LPSPAIEAGNVKEEQFYRYDQRDGGEIVFLDCIIDLSFKSKEERQVIIKGVSKRGRSAPFLRTCISLYFNFLIPIKAAIPMAIISSA
jgi:hypothetical protein